MAAQTVKQVDFANCAGWKMGRKARGKSGEEEGEGTGNKTNEGTKVEQTKPKDLAEMGWNDDAYDDDDG